MRKNKWKWLVLGIVAALIMGILTGCTPSDKSTVLTIGDKKMTYGEANFYARYYQSSYEMYSSFMGSTPETMWSQFVGEDKTLEDNVKDTLKDALETMLILSQHMDEYGVEITDADEAQISATADAFIEANDERTLKVMSATKENVESILRYMLINQKMQKAMIEDTDREVSDDEAARKTMNYVKIPYDSTKTDSQDFDAENLEEMADELTTLSRKTAQEEADYIYDKVKNCKSADEFNEIAESCDFPATQVSYAEDGEDPSSVLCAAMWDQKKDSILKSIEDEDQEAFYLAYQVTNIDQDATKQAKEEVIAEREKENYEAKYQKLKEASNISWKEGAWKQISFIKQGVVMATEDEVVDTPTEEEPAAELNTDTSLTAEDGDTVNIDYKGMADGKAFDGGTAKAQDLVLGSGQFIPGFEDQVVGHHPGETFTIDVTFPEDYQSKDLAGKDAQFEIVLNGIYK